MPPQIRIQLFLGLKVAHAFISEFVALVAIKYLNYIALFCEFNSLFVRILLEAPENCSQAIGLAVMKAIGAAFLSLLLPIEIRLPAEGLDAFLENRLGFANIFLIGG